MQGLQPRGNGAGTSIKLLVRETDLLIHAIDQKRVGFLKRLLLRPLSKQIDQIGNVIRHHD
jgi:hypothetical protein